MNYITSNTEPVKDWKVQATIHAAPIGGWNRTNECRHTCALSPIDMTHDVTTHKSRTRLFAPVVWRDPHGPRRITNIKYITALVLDFDKIPHVAKRKLIESFDGVLSTHYSTFSHNSERACFRSIVGLSRPVTPQEYGLLWRWMYRIHPSDRQTKDPSRIWYLPSCTAEHKRVSFIHHIDGGRLDVDAILSSIEKEHPKDDMPNESPKERTVSLPRREADDRYTVVRCPASYPIRGYDGSTHQFGWYIKNWDKLQKHTTGNVQAYATDSGSLGSGFISRSVDMWGIPRYRFTMCNSKKVHMDCIVTDHDLEIRFGDKNRSWSYLKSPDNLINMLELLFEDKLWFCEVRQRLFMDRSPIDDPKEIQIMNLLRKKFYHGQTLSIDMVRQALLLYGNNNSCNPLREYLESLRGKWNPNMESHCTTLFSKFLCAPDTELAQVYGRKWPLSCVARVLSPGCKVDTMMVVKAAQGHGKGTFYRTLAGSCPRTGYSWYNSSKINIGEKDGRSILRTAWIHEMAELSSMAKKDANVIKNFLDEQFDTYRPVYRTHEVKEPRQCVFTGSTNDNDIGIFKDKTGSRRYWFLELQSRDGQMGYDPKELAEVRDMIWAEAVWRFDNEEQWWLTPQEQQLSTAHNAEYTVESIHETLVNGFLSQHTGKFFTIKEMLQHIYTHVEGDRRVPTTIRPMNYENFYPSLLLRMGAVLQNGGRKCRRKNIDGVTTARTGYWLAP